MTRISRKWAAIIVVVALVGIGGAAFAYWTTTGSGTGTAATTTTSAVTVTQTSTITAMGPGVAAQTLSGKFDNPNSGPVYVASVSATVTGTDKTGCTASDFTIGGTAPVNTQVPAGTAQGSWTGLTIAFNNKAGVNQDACKGATVSIAYTSN